ncbi:unnamed protein product [Discosporangium mesarthrocarpum]
MPPLEEWAGSLARNTEPGGRPYTRTLVASEDAYDESGILWGSRTGKRVPIRSSGRARVSDTGDLEPRKEMNVGMGMGFDLLVLCWSPGAESPIHNHPGAGCWVKVLQGEICETRYRQERHPESLSVESTGSNVIGSKASTDCSWLTDLTNPDVLVKAPLVKAATNVFRVGSVAYMEDSLGYHRMSNPSSTTECITLHLYSPGIRRCSIWERATSRPKESELSVDGTFTSLLADGTL